MGIGQIHVLACDNCFNLRSSQPEGALRSWLLIAGLAAAVAAVGFVVPAVLRRGGVRIAAASIAIGLVLGVLAVPPVVSEASTTTYGKPTYCGRPTSASTNEYLVGDDGAVVACQRAIDDAVTRSLRMLLTAFVVVAAGIVVGITRRRQGGSQPTARAPVAPPASGGPAVA